VSPGLRSKQLHQCVIVFLFCPVALPFEEGCDGGQPHCAGLHHAGERGFLSGRRSRTAAILDDINVVACADHFDGWPGHTHLRPETGHDDVLLAGCFDGFAEFHGVPGVHGTAFNHRLAGKHIQQLWPDIAAERFGFDSSKHRWHVEFICAFASSVTLLISEARSMLATPKSICGWWSLNTTAESSGV